MLRDRGTDLLAASFAFLSPLGLAVCATALVPVGTLLVVALRQRRVAALLQLPQAGIGPVAGTAALAGGACLALGLAAGQPALEISETRQVRSESQIVFVVDVSRSMLASEGPGTQTRLDRARSIVGRLRAAAPDVPAGLSGLTDRVLPYLFPTLDPAVFEDTLRRSVLPESPPPEQVSAVATTFDPLAALTTNGFFSRSAKRRTCVLVSDGESRSSTSDSDQGLGDGAGSPLPLGFGALGGGSDGLSADVSSPGSALAGHALAGVRGCRLVVVRVGGSADRIYAEGGRVEAQYRPEPTASAVVEQLATAAGGRAFTENEVPAASRAVRAATAAGPLEAVGVRISTHSLAPYLAALALALALLSVGGRLASRSRWYPAREFDAS